MSASTDFNKIKRYSGIEQRSRFLRIRLVNVLSVLLLRNVVVWHRKMSFLVPGKNCLRPTMLYCSKMVPLFIMLCPFVNILMASMKFGSVEAVPGNGLLDHQI